MLTIAGQYDLHAICRGAAMPGAEGNDPAMFIRLMSWERSEQAVGYIAGCGLKFEPANPFWNELLGCLPETTTPKDDVMPHPTRFVAMNGYERGIGKKITTEWQRPQRPAA